MGCFCVSERGNQPQVVEEEEPEKKPSISSRVDRQMRVKRELVNTAMEGEIWESFDFGSTLGAIAIVCRS